MSPKKCLCAKTGFFRFKPFGSQYLVTSDTGEFVFLGLDAFQRLANNSIDEKMPEYNRLKKNGFLLDKDDFKADVEKYRLKNEFLGDGASLHIVVVTLRCNYACLYCHASVANDKGKALDMSIETAKHVVDRIFESPSSSITIEFQGGEPLLNMETVRFIVKYAKEKNALAKKNLLIAMVTNLSLMTDEILDYFLKNRISLCTSIDGPRKLHNKNRIPLDKNNSYDEVTNWFKKITKAYHGRVIYKPNALTTITRYSLDYPKEIVDEYIQLGLEGIHIRPVHPFGMAGKKWGEIGYTSNDFLDFYYKAMDYIIQLNLKGKNFYERTARIFLTKIFTEKDPSYLELRSPCGAGIGQLAYNYNGDVYTCDEGRMVSRLGDESFKINNARGSSYTEFIKSDTVKAVSTASVLDGLPGCSSCVYKPYCGVCPIYNYITGKSMFSQMPNNEKCRINKGILDYIFKKMQDKRIDKLFKKWVSIKMYPMTI